MWPGGVVSRVLRSGRRHLRSATGLCALVDSTMLTLLAMGG